MSSEEKNQVTPPSGWRYAHRSDCLGDRAGSQACTAATHAEWGRYKALQRLLRARGDNFPSTRATPLFCPPSLLTQSLEPRMERLLSFIFITCYIYLTFCFLQFFSFLVRFSQASSTNQPASLHPTPVPDRLLIRLFTILNHSAVQPCSGRAGLHIQELYIGRLFISPACGGFRSIHAHQILTSALFCCKIYRLF